MVDILGSVDEKIENNEKIIANLERFAITEYQKISQDCTSVLTLGDIVDIFDNKRKPLSSRQRADRQGDYR